MATLWELMTGTTVWQRTPLPHLKIKPFDLCHNLYTLPSFNCVAWSEDNFIAFTSIDGLRNGQANCGIQQPIFIVRPDHTHTYITLVTSHAAPIRVLEWSPISCGQFLLSADSCDRVCIWRMRDHIDDWACIATYRFENVIATRWLSTDQKTAAIKGQSPLASTFSPNTRKGLQIPPGMPAVISVSALMVVTLIFQGFIEGMWGCISCSMSVAPPPLPLSCADIHVTSTGQVLVAIAGPHLGNSVAVYEVTLDLFSSSVTSQLKSRVELGMPASGPILPSLLLSPLRAVPTVCHLVFDPFSDGLALLTISAGLGASDSVRLERWEYKPTAIQRDKIFPASLSPSLRSQYMIDLWVVTGSVVLEAPQSMVPLACIDPLNPSFVTTFRCTPSGVIWLGYLNGYIEARDCRTLNILHAELGNSRTSTSDGALSETLTTVPHTPPIIVATSASPNCASICMLYYSGQLRVIVGANKNDNEDTYIRQLSDMLELSMVRGSDPWDVYALLKNESPHICDFVLVNIGKDLLSLAEPQYRFFVYRWESLRGQVHSLAGHSIASLDCQARSFMLFILDTIRSTLTHTLPGSSTAKSFEEALSHTGLPSTHETSTLHALVPFADWIVDFSNFFLRCISLFVKLKSHDDVAEASPFLIPEGTCKPIHLGFWIATNDYLAYLGGDLALYFPLYSKHIGGLLFQLPFVNFLFEPTTVQTLLELLVLSGTIVSKSSSQTVGSRSKYELTEIKRIHSLVSVVAANCVGKMVMGAVDFKQVLQTLKDSLENPLAGFGQQDLTLINTEASLLDLNLYYGQHGGTHITTNNLDVITRQPLNDKQFRRCLRCRRVSSLAKSASIPWRERWSAACPICGGKWTVP